MQDLFDAAPKLKPPYPPTPKAAIVPPPLLPPHPRPHPLLLRLPPIPPHENVNTELSSSCNYADIGATAELVRTALRNRRGKEEIEEKWIFYSEVVHKISDEEVTSCCNQRIDNKNINCSVKLIRLALKLDYNEIIDAWADMGRGSMEGEEGLEGDGGGDEDGLEEMGLGGGDEEVVGAEEGGKVGEEEGELLLRGRGGEVGEDGLFSTFTL